MKPPHRYLIPASYLIGFWIMPYLKRRQTDTDMVWLQETIIVQVFFILIIGLCFAGYSIYKYLNEE